jgi:hypothetical protein
MMQPTREEKRDHYNTEKKATEIKDTGLIRNVSFTAN